MKNIRKIVAILAAVLMLCSVIPMSAIVSADINMDFEDGINGWQSDVGVEAVELDGSKVLKWDASGAAWANMYNYCNLSANTEYVLNLKVKADRDTDMNFKVLPGDWSATTYVTTFAVTTEWQEVTVQFNSGNGSFVMLSSNADVGHGATYYVDNFSIVEYVAPAVPGQIVNGDFETGDATGWNLPQVGSVKAEAAHDGSYGINLIGNGGWGGMLDQTIPVNAGKSYEITFWLKVNATGINVQIKDGGTSGANIGGDWVDMNKAGEWKQFTYIVTPTADALTINFCGSGSAAEDVYVDSIVVTELKDPSFDGYIYNGDFEVGDLQSWDPVWWAGNISLVEGGHNSDYAMLTNQGQWQLVRQKVSVKPNTNYVVSVYAKSAHDMTLLVKDGNDSANLMQAGITAGDEWTKVSLEFNSGNWNEVYVGVMGNVAGATAIVDDFFMFEKPEASNDGYIINGNFETGDIQPWNNLWGSCPKAEVVKGGKDSNFALDIVSGQWKHVRQTNIAVEANTTYKITAWAKNTKGMSLLVKDGGDSVDLRNAGIEAGEEWTEFVVEFNTGDYTSIIFSLMGNNAEAAFGTFDNIVMEKVEAPVCEHEYDDCDDADCNLCGETREPGHKLTYVPAVVPANCLETGHEEYWKCSGCNAIFGDAEGSNQLNPSWINYNGECVRPEGAADCANVPCEVCGNEIYGYGEHDVLACQGGACSKCGEEIEGYGCANYDTPACEDGVCYYCGGFVAGFGHENGAWAACCDGECSYGCGLIYPATEDHIDEDADDYCDNCWNHLACVDEDGNNECDVCFAEMPALPPVEIIYGDANGDGDVTAMDVILLQQYTTGWEVELDEVSADANGDGDVTAMDVILLQQYTTGWDVTLGPDPV